MPAEHLPAPLLAAPAVNVTTQAVMLSIVRRLLREPLVHFLFIGVLVFAIYDLLNPAVVQSGDASQIVLTKDDLRQLAIAWLAQGRGAPTAEQMRALVEQRVNEEILSREAVAMGLDQGDEIIKRRLAQKMDFLANDIAALQNPTEGDLRKWFVEHAERFALPARVSFRHIYFTLDRGPGARDAAATALASITGKPVDALASAGDPFMFQDYYADRNPDQVTREFGPEFSKAVFGLDPGAWRGPIQSGYGWHLVYVTGKDPSRVPNFEEVEPDIKSAWLENRQAELKRAAFAAMRARYKVAVAPIDAAELAKLSVPPAATAAASEVVPQ
jgi:parvulin-like peptidyl-prolyl isomerase